jgi:hypothetical protein
MDKLPTNQFIEQGCEEDNVENLRAALADLSVDQLAVLSGDPFNL